MVELTTWLQMSADTEGTVSIQATEINSAPPTEINSTAHRFLSGKTDTEEQNSRSCWEEARAKEKHSI